MNKIIGVVTNSLEEFNNYVRLKHHDGDTTSRFYQVCNMEYNKGRSYTEVVNIRGWEEVDSKVIEYAIAHTIPMKEQLTKMPVKRSLLERFFRWLFKSEFQRLEELIQTAGNELSNLRTEKIEFRRMSKSVHELFKNMDISVDVHEYNHRFSPSWAVISIQGKRTDYIKFMNLGDRDVHHISEFLRQFELLGNTKIDAAPNTTQFLKISQNEKRRFF